MVPGESPCYITFLTFHTFHTFHTFLTFHTFHTFLTFLKYLTLGFPVKPVFFWVGFLAQHGPEPPSPILLLKSHQKCCTQIRYHEGLPTLWMVQKIFYFNLSHHMHHLKKQPTLYHCNCCGECIKLTKRILKYIEVFSEKPNSFRQFVVRFVAERTTRIQPYVQ